MVIYFWQNWRVVAASGRSLAVKRGSAAAKRSRSPWSGSEVAIREASWLRLSCAWIVAGSLATQLHVETDILSLVPRHNPGGRGLQDHHRAIRDGRHAAGRCADRARTGRSSRCSPSPTSWPSSLERWDQIDWVSVQGRPECRNRRTVAGPGDALPRPGPGGATARPARYRKRLGGGRAALQSTLLAPQSLVTKDVLKADPMGLLPGILAEARFGGVGISVDPGDRLSHRSAATSCS